MFNKKTVLILGAGASWHYGYPTGEGLVEDVIAAAETVANYLENRLRAGRDDIPTLLEMPILKEPEGDLRARHKAASILCRELASRLSQVSPLVIDYFLGWNNDLADIGRVMIAFALLKREALGGGAQNYNRVLASRAEGAPDPKPHHFNKDNWLRFVIHQLLLGCKTSEQLLLNQLNIISFNYDLSAERRITAALRSTSFLAKSDVDTFRDKDRFLHMYGALRPLELNANNFNAFDLSYPMESLTRIDRADTALDASVEAAKDIRVIDPHNKANGPESDKAQALIRNAERIYILGFGFDPNNVQRLGLLQPTMPPKRICFTNWNNAMSVNKRVAAALGIGTFEDPDNWKGSRSNPPPIERADKSIRDCYDALALDFGAFEDCSSG